MATPADRPGPASPDVPGPPDPVALLRSRNYLRLLVLAAILGVPISAVAYGFLALVSYLQKEIFTHLPHGLGFGTEPVWWPLPVLAVGGVLAGFAIRYLPGKGGPSAAGAFAVHAPPTAVQLPGVILAALATLVFGAVLGPEMPLIALGGGLAALVIRLARRRDVPDQAARVLGVTGSFAAVSTLLGSPLTGAFLLMEASGLGGPMLGVVLLPGLLAAGIGSLIFIGLDNLTGLGTFSLALPGIPGFSQPTGAEFGWAIAIGLAAALIGPAIRRLALLLKPYADRWPMLVVPLAGVAVAVLAIIYAEATGKPTSDVLFSGENALDPLITHAASYSVGALLLLMVCKGLAYGGVAEQLPGRPRLPGHVHRRGRRHRPVPPARAAADRRCRHGHRRDDRGDAHPADHLGAARHAAAGLGRPGPHATGDRGGGRRPRRRRPPRPAPGRAAERKRADGQRCSRRYCRADVKQPSEILPPLGLTGQNVTNRCHCGARISSGPVPGNPSVHRLAGQRHPLTPPTSLSP